MRGIKAFVIMEDVSSVPNVKLHSSLTCIKIFGTSDVLKSNNPNEKMPYLISHDRN
jgi:hypothetical protein